MMSHAGVLREAKKGAAEMVVLAMLEADDHHGYELVGMIDGRSNGELTFNFASLYATLYKLEERGLVRGRWVERAGQRRRRYYRITPSGRVMLSSLRNEWQRFFKLMHDLAGVSYA